VPSSIAGIAAKAAGHPLLDGVALIGPYSLPSPPRIDMAVPDSEEFVDRC
jgi:hypothetical protein